MKNNIRGIKKYLKLISKMEEAEIKIQGHISYLSEMADFAIIKLILDIKLGNKEECIEVNHLYGGEFRCQEFVVFYTNNKGKLIRDYILLSEYIKHVKA